MRQRTRQKSSQFIDF